MYWYGYDDSFINPLATDDVQYVVVNATFLISTSPLVCLFFGYSKSCLKIKSWVDAETWFPSIASGNNVWFSILPSDRGVLHKRNSSILPSKLLPPIFISLPLVQALVVADKEAVLLDKLTTVYADKFSLSTEAAQKVAKNVSDFSALSERTADDIADFAEKLYGVRFWNRLSLIDFVAKE